MGCQQHLWSARFASIQHKMPDVHGYIAPALESTWHRGMFPPEICLFPPFDKIKVAAEFLIGDLMSSIKAEYKVPADIEVVELPNAYVLIDDFRKIMRYHFITKSFPQAIIQGGRRNMKSKKKAKPMTKAKTTKAKPMTKAKTTKAKTTKAKTKKKGEKQKNKST